jgi:glycosyltransferase involved in cell wall biosynthesis
MKVALIHDWLNGMRGGEKVLEQIIELYPNCDIYTLFHEKGKLSPLIESRPIYSTFVERLPFVFKKYRNYLPLFPTAIETFDLNGYDLIISSSHCVAKGVITPPGSTHVSYVHTPMRYVWDMFGDYFGPGKKGRLTRALVSLFANYLRMWDVTSSARVDSFVANSSYVASRVNKFYRREAAVINPPVNVDRFTIGQPKDYYLVVSAFAPYKKVELAIKACSLRNAKLKVIGDGQDAENLKKLAGPNVEFCGWRENEEIAQYYREARAFLFPGLEDFGITPVESMASGRPVIAFGQGGARETVVPANQTESEKPQKPTGVFFHEQTPQALADAMEYFEKNESLFKPEIIRERALEYSEQSFRTKFKAHVDGLLSSE